MGKPSVNAAHLKLQPERRWERLRVCNFKLLLWQLHPALGNSFRFLYFDGRSESGVLWYLDLIACLGLCVDGRVEYARFDFAHACLGNNSSHHRPKPGFDVSRAEQVIGMPHHFRAILRLSVKIVGRPRNQTHGVAGTDMLLVCVRTVSAVLRDDQGHDRREYTTRDPHPTCKRSSNSRAKDSDVSISLQLSSRCSWIGCNSAV